MANIEHSNIPDGQRHEPKGAASASAGDIYVADGAGSGTWRKVTEDELNNPGTGLVGQALTSDGNGGFEYRDMPHGSFVFENVSTPYTQALTLTNAALTPTTTNGSGSQTDMTQNSSGRLTYTGDTDRHFHIAISLSFDHTAGVNRTFVFTAAKNGIALPGLITMTTSSGNRVSSALHADVVLSTNDYIEIFARNTGTGTTINLYSLYVFAMGMLRS